MKSQQWLVLLMAASGVVCGMRAQDTADTSGTQITLTRFGDGQQYNNAQWRLANITDFNLQRLALRPKGGCSVTVCSIMV
jgi:hypothetical protein